MVEWKDVMEIASQQLGLISRAQIEAAGFSKGMLASRLRKAEWFRVHPGWFKVGNAPMTADQRVLATMLVAGPEAVISHMTAARRLGLDVPRTQLIDLTVPITCRGRRYEYPRVYRARDMRPYHWFQDGPFRVTTIERTVLDLAGVLKGRWLSALFYSAIRKHPATAELIQFLVMEQEQGRVGISRLQALLDAQPGRVPESVPESFLLELIRDTGLQPVVQYPFGPKQRVDLAWPEHRLVVEVDSWMFHSSFHAYGNDRARDRAVARAGWTTLRFTRDEVVRTPSRVIGEIRELLEARIRDAVGAERPASVE